MKNLLKKIAVPKTRAKMNIQFFLKDEYSKLAKVVDNLVLAGIHFLSTMVCRAKWCFFEKDRNTQIERSVPNILCRNKPPRLFYMLII